MLDPNRTYRMVKEIEETRYQFSVYASANGGALLNFLDKCRQDNVDIPPQVSEFANNFYQTMEQVDVAYSGLLRRLTEDIKRTDLIFEQQQDFILNDVAKLAQEKDPFNPDPSNDAFKSMCNHEYLTMKHSRYNEKTLKKQASKAHAKVRQLHSDYYEMKSKTIPKALARVLAINKRIEEVEAKAELNRKRKELIQQRRLQMEAINRQYQQQMASTMQLNSQNFHNISWDSEDLSETAKKDGDDLHRPGNEYEEDDDVYIYRPASSHTRRLPDSSSDSDNVDALAEQAQRLSIVD